jgi:hypothetical protein
MRCVDPGPGARPTHIVDGRALGLANAERKLLKWAVWNVARRPEGFLAPVLSGPDDTIRYDPGCMRPAHKAFEHAAEIWRCALDAAAPLRIDWRAGDAVIVDNRRMLHGRGAARAPDEHRRILERVLVASG